MTTAVPVPERVLIFANGELTLGEWLDPFWAGATAVFGADGGTKYILQAGQRPTAVFGDFDSLDPAILAQLTAEGVPCHRYPAAKDETDLELTLLHAVRTHPTAEIAVFGVLGGRLDQTLANIFLLAHPDLIGHSIRLIEPQQQAWLVHERTEIVGQVGDVVSLIPLGGEVVIRRTQGLQWGLEGERLIFGPARGVSNRLTAATAVVELISGQLLCIHTEQAWGR